MTNREIVEASRRALELHKRQVEANAWMQELSQDRPDVLIDARALLDELAVCADQWGEAAVRVLRRLPPGRECVVLWQYYLLGLSVNEIRKGMQCDLRTVTRAKARGLEMLDEMDKGGILK